MRELTASEIVLFHAPRFVETVARGIAVPGHETQVGALPLGRVLVAAAVVGAAQAGWIELRREPVGGLLGLLYRREVVVTPREHAAAPAGTLEARIASAATIDSDLATVLRTALGEARPDPIARVRAGALQRGVLIADGDVPAIDTELAREAAQRVHAMLADFRERDPALWIAITRAIDRALLTWLPQVLLAWPTRRTWRPRRREAIHVDLRDWQRLNRNPPRADR